MQDEDSFGRFFSVFSLRGLVTPKRLRCHESVLCPRARRRSPSQLSDIWMMGDEPSNASDVHGIHYLRIAKSGSTSLLAMLAWSRRTHKRACAPLHTHFHNVLSRHLPAGAKSFVVMREPCSRFASSYDFVRRPEGRRKHARDVVHTFDDGSTGAIKWASRMLRNESYRTMWMQTTSVGPSLAPHQTMSHASQQGFERGMARTSVIVH